ncbi:MAG: TauD/TfdA family dioxygenase, partial [Saprospiraceae bacterium]|nr:TauD/TfdA family dioxygenase [Saprospiraceae bacterium]MDZ4703281.1 TauD/TfdA family dioxygenase [Saprospiraceae bacterium]
NDEPGSKTLSEVFKHQYPEIKKILLDGGAILFKSFGIDNPLKLQECANTFPGKSIDYAGGNSPRTNLHGNVYTSTEQPAESWISLHNELSYASIWPSHIFFCCETPAQEGGNTTIADSRKILADLSPEVVKIFRKKGVQYIRNLHGGQGAGPSWQQTFETQNPADVELHCKSNDILFEWGRSNKLKLIEKRQAIIKHAETQEEVWFNQADQFHPSTNSEEIYEALMEIYEDNLQEMPQYVCFNDGSEIPLEMLEEIRKVGHRNTVLFDWEKGDLLLLDNILSAHGRSPFKGPRKILVAMTS